MTFNPTPAETAQQMREWRINDLLRGAQQAHVFAHGVRKAEDAIRIVALCDDAGQSPAIRDATRDFCETPTALTADAFVRVAVKAILEMLP